MEIDIGPLLDGWPYGGGANVRLIRGQDGREKVQIRVRVDSYHGILQFNCDGRPDGRRPHGREFLLDHLEEKKKAAERSPNRAAFRLSRAHSKELFDESYMTYQRYVVLLQMGEYPRVIRDTERNMKLFRFVRAHADHAEDRVHLEQWWPYLLRIHYTARTLKAVGEEQFDDAFGAIRECHSHLDALKEQDNETFRNEMARSRSALQALVKEVEEKRPASELERLEQEKKKAIEDQRYEEAALLRDRITALREDDREAPAPQPRPPAAP